MTRARARENVDNALYDWVKSLGLNPNDFDYSGLNEVLDDIEALLA